MLSFSQNCPPSNKILTNSQLFLTDPRISEILNRNSDKTPDIDIDKLQHFTNSKLPGDTFFHIPLITRGQVISFINKLDSTKATGIDGLGPKIIKLAADILSP